MFNEESFEKIKNRILINTKLDIAKNEGSILNAWAGARALELAKLYLYMNDIINIAFIENASGEYLDKRAAEFGIIRKNGEFAVGSVNIYGEEGTKVQVGEEITTGGQVFVTQNGGTIERQDEALKINVIAKSIGKRGNIPAGTFFEFIGGKEGINYIVSGEPFKYGVDVESDDDFKDRFFFMQRNKGTSGNVYDYINWSLEVAGVKNARVKPLWNGNGTVKVVITADDNQNVSEDILKNCQEYINEKKPIGADVTVVTPTPVDITITATIELTDDNVDIPSLQEKFKNVINAMFIREFDGEVTYTKVARELSKLDEVNDYKELKINEGVANIKITDEQVAKVKTVTFSKGVVE